VAGSAERPAATPTDASGRRPGNDELGDEKLGDEKLGDEKLGTERQPIVRQPGRARRAKLLPAPDTDPNPISTGSSQAAELREEGGVAHSGAAPSANDARLRQDRPPHW